MYKKEKYNEDQLWVLARGRGNVKEYGNIDDLDPDKYDSCRMENISLARGSDERYGNIDNFEYENFEEEDTEYESLCNELEN